MLLPILIALKVDRCLFSVSLLITFFTILKFLNKNESKVICTREFCNKLLDIFGICIFIIKTIYVELSVGYIRLTL
jgi:hypothetical protein